MRALAFFIFSAIFCITALSGSAQQNTTLLKRNSIFLEALGNGGYYSLNVDRILTSKENWKLAGRVGGSYTNSFDKFNNQWFSMPLEFSYLRGKKNNFLEIGIGATPMYGKYDLIFGGPGEEKYRIVNFDVWVLPRIGYRYQMPDGGLFFKVGFTPFYSIKLYSNASYFPVGYTYTFPVWGGVAIGHTFR